MYIPNRHVNASMSQELCRELLPIFHLLFKSEKILSLPYASKEEAGALNLGHMPRVVTDRSRMGIWSSDSSTTLPILEVIT